MAALVDRDCADSAIFEVDVEPAELFVGLELVKLAAALGRGEITVVDLRQPLFDRELVGTRARQHDMRRVLHHRTGETDRVFGAHRPGNGTRAAIPPVHDRGVERIGALIGKHRAATGVEVGVVLEHTDRSFDGVERTAAGLEHGRSLVERQCECRADRLVILGLDPGAFDDARAAVNHECPFGGGSGSDGHDCRR